MNDLTVVFQGTRVNIAAGQVAKVGRDPSSTVVIEDPRVSREHLRIHQGPSGWSVDCVGRAGTYLAGVPVTEVAVNGTKEIALAAPDGPMLRFEPGESIVAPGPAPHMPGAGIGGSRQPGDGGGLATALRVLVPLRSWITNPGWHQGLRLLVIPYALLPMAYLAMFLNSGNLTTPGWAYALYVAPLWVIAFWFLIRPGRVHWRELGIAAIAIGWVLLWVKLVTIPINGHLGNPNGELTFPDALGVGYNEEVSKALPILVIALGLLFLRKVKLDVRMWMFAGAVVGMAFGVYEATQYAAAAIVDISNAHANNDAVVPVLQFAERVFVDGFQHAIWAGMSGFFIGIAVNYRRRRVPLILFGVTVPAVLHGLNDWIAGPTNSIWPMVGIQALSLVLFLGYSMTAKQIEEDVRHSPVFRGSSLALDPSMQVGPVPD